MINLPDLSTFKVSPSSLVFLLQGNQVLTLRRAPNKQIFPGKLSGFGGKVEPGDELFAAAKREFIEETGLTLLDLQLKGNLVVFMGNGYINFVYLFVATKFTGQLLSSTEEGTTSWMSVDDFYNSADRVDHIGYYFRQIIQPNSDLYVGVINRVNGQIIDYNDNSGHFATRKQP